MLIGSDEHKRYIEQKTKSQYESKVKCDELMEKRRNEVIENVLELIEIMENTNFYPQAISDLQMVCEFAKQRNQYKELAEKLYEEVKKLRHIKEG